MKLTFPFFLSDTCNESRKTNKIQHNFQLLGSESLHDGGVSGLGLEVRVEEQWVG